jgi:hypothetical protein
MPVTHYPLTKYVSTGTTPDGALIWNTPSGGLENNIIIMSPDGQHYLVIALEYEDVVPVPANWATGTHLVDGLGDTTRSGVRIAGGGVNRDDEDDMWGIRGLRDEKQANDNGTVVNPPGRPD